VKAWIVVAAIGAGSYVFRISMLVLAARHRIPPVVMRATRHAVPVSFAALAASSLAGQLTGAGAVVPPMAAVIVAALAARRTGSPPVALAAGMPVLWLLSALLPH
jgi:branched-subunit amino acid transport protein